MNKVFPNLKVYLGDNFTRKEVEELANFVITIKSKGYHYPEVLEQESESYLAYCHDMDMGYGR